MDDPPTNDVCSICHAHFHVPCQANCSHWFCGQFFIFPRLHSDSFICLASVHFWGNYCCFFELLMRSFCYLSSDFCWLCLYLIICIQLICAFDVTLHKTVYSLVPCALNSYGLFILR